MGLSFVYSEDGLNLNRILLFLVRMIFAIMSLVSPANIAVKRRCLAVTAKVSEIAPKLAIA